MDETLRFFTLDVFTDTPFTGNPLAVVLDGDDLTDAQMLAIAREFNLSETIFVLPPEDPALTARVRIFMPGGEIPFAGHPTIGCACLLGELRNGSGDFTDRIVLGEEAGPVPVALTRRGGVTGGELVAPVVPSAVDDAETAFSDDLIADALGIPVEAIGFGDHAPGVFEGGPAFLYVPVMDRYELASASPSEPAWSQLTEAAGVESVYLYTPGREADFQARMFAPGDGIPEDPATGSAAAILAGQLHASGALPRGEATFRILQGVEMERPSRITLHTLVDEGTVQEVRVSGSAVRISSGTLVPPPAAS